MNPTDQRKLNIVATIGRIGGIFATSLFFVAAAFE